MWHESPALNFLALSFVVVVWSMCRLQVSTIQLEEKLARRAELLVARASAGLEFEVKHDLNFNRM